MSTMLVDKGAENTFDLAGRQHTSLNLNSLLVTRQMT